MQYKIEGTPLPVVTCSLNMGEVMITESGGMSWMSDNMEMSTNTGGGLAKGISRMFSGESLFINQYTAGRDGAYIAFASCFPGEIIAYDVSAQGPLIIQKSAFLAAEATVDLAMHFRKKLGSGLFGGEGFIMQRISGRGVAFLEIDGSVIKKDLAQGEIIKVDTGHVAAYTESVYMDIESVKGFKNILFGGEGLFNTVLRGPGTVFLQTMPISNVAGAIIPYLPSKNN